MTSLAARTDTVGNTLAAVDWDALDEAEPVVTGLLRSVAADKALMRHLINEAVSDKNLAAKCETYDLLDKIVLFHDPVSDVRLRLHVFKKGDFDRPHNHRFSYGSIVLLGGFCHLLFGSDESFNTDRDIANLRPLHRCYETPGKGYMLHHSMVHSIQASPGTVTLVARGPAMKRVFTVSDRLTNEVWSQVGAADETPQERFNKVMTVEALGVARAQLIENLAL